MNLKKKIFIIPFVVLLSVILASCTNTPENTDEDAVIINQDDYTEPLIIANKESVRLEDGDIDLFIKRYGWEMHKSETGLRYFIFNQGDSYHPKEKDKVELAYSMRLIDGTDVYNSDTDGNKEFALGKSDEINGLQEAVKMMGVGGKARLVIPSYLAYGMSGDGFLIRQRISIIMEIEIINIKKTN